MKMNSKILYKLLLSMLCALIGLGLLGLTLFQFKSKPNTFGGDVFAMLIFFLPVSCLIIFASGEIFNRIKELNKIKDFFLSKKGLYRTLSIFVFLFVISFSKFDYGVFELFLFYVITIVCYFFSMVIYFRINKYYGLIE